jgi:hypothetical protein
MLSLQRDILFDRSLQRVMLRVLFYRLYCNMRRYFFVMTIVFDVYICLPRCVYQFCSRLILRVNVEYSSEMPDEASK